MCAAAAEQPVAFSATFMTADHHGLGVGQTLKFDKVIYNAGNAYNPATGLFIAPTDGTYIYIYYQCFTRTHTYIGTN